MTEQIFEKELTANDVGETGGHQAGMHIPKKQKELVEFLPGLDPKIKNPDTWLHCKDADGNEWKFRYIHYNNRLHDPGGTRNEYRITHMTPYFRAVGARSGDNFRVSGVVGENAFRISVVTSALKKEAPQDQKTRIKLRGWRRVH
jgi:hypothetical protein